jgi:hypothetical protein
MSKPSSCPSEFTLERWRFGELATSEQERQLIEHVARCPECQSRQAELAAPEQLRPSTEEIWARAAGADRPRRPRWQARLWQGTAVAVVAAAAVFFVSRGKAPDVLPKGVAWQLGVIAKAHDGRVRHVDPGAALSPGDKLRFEVATSRPQGHVALVMLDSAGKVSRLAPLGTGTLPVPSGKRVLLEEAVVPDGVLGPERIVLVGCDRPLRVEEVVVSAEHALATAGGDPRQVGSLGTGCHEESFWISKVRQ